MSDSDDGYSYSDLEYSSEDDGGNDADAGLVEIENTFYDADGSWGMPPTCSQPQVLWVRVTVSTHRSLTRA